MKARQPKMLAAILMLSIAALACSLPGMGAEPTTIPTTSPEPPADTATPVPTAAPQPLVIETCETIEEGDIPYFIITLRVPCADEASGDPRGQEFNDAVDAVIQPAVSAFKNSLEPPIDPNTNVPSGLDAGHIIHYNNNGLVSIQFTMSEYHAGAAHPLPYTLVLNYDFEQGRVLELSDLFQPGSDHLALVSEKSLEQLEDAGVMDAPDGAAPLEDNYRNWNLRENGLVVTFDPYQVAAYAAGYQIVVLDYADLAPILLSGGPVSRILDQD